MIQFTRKTLAQPTGFDGFGLHSAQEVKVTVHPGSDGLAFRHGPNRWLATPENVTDTRRCTRLGEISTVEHLMSALAGLGITDAEIELTGGTEMPALDGAARCYFDGLHTAGATDLGEVTVDGVFARVYEKGPAHEIAIGRGDGHWRYTFDLGDRWPGVQSFEWQASPSSYGDEIAPARTFALEEEMPMIQQAGLGKGLDATTAFMIGTEGYLNATKFPEEPARHKMLDLIGDLFLAGLPPQMLNVVAEKSGHTANVAAAAKLAQAIRRV